MDNIKKAKYLLRLAEHDKTLRRYQNTADEYGVNKVLKKFLEQEKDVKNFIPDEIFVIVKVLTNADEFLINGKPDRVAEWLEKQRDDGHLVEWEMVDATANLDDAKDNGLSV